jgi:hypothetical protein
MTGFYKTFVETVTRGTSLVPQFTFGIIKTLVGARMSGNVTFDIVDNEPRRYFAAIGETGSGKGEAWRRTEGILFSLKGAVEKPYLKVIASADSGAGLKDFFFEEPAARPVVCYIDEITSLGNKSAEGRNPDILDTIMELADSMTISRVLKKRGKVSGTRTKDDARLVMVMCGPNGSKYAKAFVGRDNLGIFDRLTPEFAEPTIAGDMPPIDSLEAAKMLSAFNRLPYGGSVNTKMTMGLEAKDRLTKFWADQTAAVRKKARFRRDLLM